MSIFIKKSDLKVKNPTTGTYQGQSLFTENDTQTQINRINSAGTTQVNAVNAKGQETLASIPDDYTELSDDVNNLKSDFNESFAVMKSKNLLRISQVEIGKYINTNGTLEDISGRAVTGYIPVQTGDVIVASYRAANGTQTREKMNSICCFDSEKNVKSGGAYNQNSFTVPSGVAYIKITIPNNVYNNASAMVESSSTGTPTSYEPYFETITKVKKDIVLKSKSFSSFRWSGVLSDGDIIRLPVTNVKNRQVYSFSGNITNFNKLHIGRIHTNGNTYGSFEIDATSVIFHRDNGTSETLQHGLIIENDIQITFGTTNELDLSFANLYSNGQMFNIYNGLGGRRFVGDEGAPYIKSEGSTLTDCSFSWTSRNINKPVWLFGDSYMSLYNSRWTYYLVQDGYEASCLINAYAGQESASAFASLQNLFTIAQPTMLLWALGMNNADSTSAVNASWYESYNNVLKWCEAYNVEPILATIPNTPTQINTFKNDIVKNSGYRFIDFAAAVGATEAGSEWFRGMLGSDQTHPTALGAKALYMKALADFPELTVL